MISFEDFQKMDIRIGKIVSAERVEGADKLIKLELDLGSDKRQLAAGIGDKYKPEELVGKQIPILANLQPKTLKGVESQGMILVADMGDDYIFLTPERDVPNGTKVR